MRIRTAYTHKPDHHHRKIYARKDQIYGALLFRRRRARIYRYTLVYIIIYSKIYRPEFIVAQQ